MICLLVLCRIYPLNNFDTRSGVFIRQQSTASIMMSLIIHSFDTFVYTKSSLLHHHHHFHRCRRSSACFLTTNNNNNNDKIWIEVYRQLKCRSFTFFVRLHHFHSSVFCVCNICIEPFFSFELLSCSCCSGSHNHRQKTTNLGFVQVVAYVKCIRKRDF